MTDAAMPFEIGKAFPMREGTRRPGGDHGHHAASRPWMRPPTLAAEGIQGRRCCTCPPSNPLTRPRCAGIGWPVPVFVTVEEHTVIGGLGSAVAELIAEADLPRQTIPADRHSRCFPRPIRLASQPDGALRHHCRRMYRGRLVRCLARPSQPSAVRAPQHTWENTTMGRLLNIVTPLHKGTKRDYLARMVDDKVHCMLKAKEYEADYWDGDRRYGYGGYKYDGRWKVVAENLIAIYDLKPGAKILDVGCGKAHLLYELQQLLPDSELPSGSTFPGTAWPTPPRASAPTCSATAPRTPIPSATSTSTW